MKESFGQIKINIPLIKAIEQVPAYTKCLKELCTRKRQNQLPKKIFLASTVSDAITSVRPVKYKDLGCPTISCILRTKKIDQALVDLETSINLLSYEVYEQLGLEELQETKVTIQLADRSTRTPNGEINDVLMKVRDFIYPVDFVVLDTMPVANVKCEIPVVLGRPFLATANALIDCRSDLMKLSFSK